MCLSVKPPAPQEFVLAKWEYTVFAQRYRSVSSSDSLLTYAYLVYCYAMSRLERAHFVLEFAVFGTTFS